MVQNWQRCTTGLHLITSSNQLYVETIMKKLNLDKLIIGVKIGSRNINNLIYANDTTQLEINGEKKIN